VGVGCQMWEKKPSKRNFGVVKKGAMPLVIPIIGGPLSMPVGKTKPAEKKEIVRTSKAKRKQEKPH